MQSGALYTHTILCRQLKPLNRLVMWHGAQVPAQRKLKRKQEFIIPLIKLIVGPEKHTHTSAHQKWKPEYGSPLSTLHTHAPSYVANMPTMCKKTQCETHAVRQLHFVHSLTHSPSREMGKCGREWSAKAHVIYSVASHLNLLSLLAYLYE